MMVSDLSIRRERSAKTKSRTRAGGLSLWGYISGIAFFLGLFVLLPGAAGGIEGGNIAGGALCLTAGLLLTFFGMAGLRGESVGE